MSDDVVERAKSALQGVTEGPWKWDGDSFSDQKPHQCPHRTRWTDHGPDLIRADTPEPDGVTPYDPSNDVITSNGYDASGLEIRMADAAFIVAARSLVPELVAEVERLQATLFVIQEARIDYDAALHNREHGGIAGDRFLNAVVAELDAVVGSNQ